MGRFGELLFEAVDDTIRLVFGECASELIYSLMERQVSVKREEVGEKIEFSIPIWRSCLVQKAHGSYRMPALNVCVLSCGESTRR